MDYVINPVICTIWCSKAAMNILPEVPYIVWAIVFAALFTGLNLRRIQATARTNEILAVAMGVVKDLLAGGYDGGFAIEPHMVAVFHDASVTAAPAALRENFVEYGRRMESLIAGIKAELGRGE